MNARQLKVFKQLRPGNHLKYSGTLNNNFKARVVKLKLKKFQQKTKTK